MVRVKDGSSADRRRVLDVVPVPAGTDGPVRVLGGRWSAPKAPAPRAAGDDLVALAAAVGVLGR